MWIISRTALAIIGLSAGFMVSGAVFTVLFVVGMVPRLAGKTDTAKYEIRYENCIIVGTMLGTVMSIFPDIPQIGKQVEAFIPNEQFTYLLQQELLIFLGIITGIYVGCLALAVAELFSALPIMIKREHLKKQISIILLIIALGKSAGALFYFFLFV